ncbi:MAG TPA: YicC family protein [Zoogloea sp.]|uniref:YicC/YloC family endoribonuclease n=1 Tax=Zoogloea sp. TaxID=49181 RepID=UPI002C83A1A1|nr:YicC/YloC family endoribonuclease [Zoogloea sp.]HMV16579.1 YicC family protein [Rhodocyclaceae bacterium]HMV62012.1 YicC family protein [Rhodocyclaceae bacterium]HMW51185.1 YicC family protein [Rhodocyclaceae bacterium]HMY48729.1 YicC family protein [Rhodocyclaceae bacterium]HMZ76834.1 YicC family protein [Rhodocyclaceae bacterium]
MIHSMTGYAVQTRELGRVALHLELRSVNSRFLDLAFRIADELRQSEPQLREALTGRLSRGKVECRFHLQGKESATAELVLNGGLLGQLKAVEAAVRAELPAAAPLSVGEILRWPGMLGDDGVGFEQIQPQIAPLLAAALEDLVASRRREGEKLADMIRGRIAHMRDLVARVQPRVPALVAEYQEKLAQRLRDASATLDDDRIRLEVGLFAQRVDVAEELSRLSTHLDEVERILKSGGTAGKRLDFLMQELNREANTLGSKAMAADMTAIAVELKLAIEQMREQVQNIE